MINVLVMSQCSPFDDLHIRDALDMTLIFAAVPNMLGIKDFFKNIKTLEIYDVENIYVCEKSLLDYGLNKNDLLLDVQALNFDQQKALIKTQQHVVNL